MLMISDIQVRGIYTYDQKAKRPKGDDCAARHDVEPRGLSGLSGWRAEFQLSWWAKNTGFVRSITGQPCRDTNSPRRPESRGCGRRCASVLSDGPRQIPPEGAAWYRATLPALLTMETVELVRREETKGHHSA